MNGMIPNIFYELDPQYWHKGYATEACQALIKFIFEVVGAPNGIMADPFVESVASQAVLRRLGFTEGKQFKVYSILYIF